MQQTHSVWETVIIKMLETLSFNMCGMSSSSFSATNLTLFDNKKRKLIAYPFIILMKDGMVFFVLSELKQNLPARGLVK